MIFYVLYTYECVCLYNTIEYKRALFQVSCAFSVADGEMEGLSQISEDFYAGIKVGLIGFLIRYMLA